MKITNIAEFTDEEALDFAVNDLGYQPTLTRQVEVISDETANPPTSHYELEEYDNPKTLKKFMEEAVIEHNSSFIQPYLNRKEREALTPVLAQIEEAREQVKTQLDARKEQVFNVVVE